MALDEDRRHPLPLDAQAAVREGDLMRAIELTRAATGLDLGASMQAVVAHATAEGLQGPDAFDQLLAGNAAPPAPAGFRHLSVTTTTVTVNGRTVSQTVSGNAGPHPSGEWVNRHRGRFVAVAAAVVVAVIAMGFLYELARGFLYQR